MKDQFKVCGIIQKRFTKNRSNPGVPGKEPTKSVSALNSHDRQNSLESAGASKEKDQNQRKQSDREGTSMRYPQRHQSQDQRIGDGNKSVSPPMNSKIKSH